MTYRIEKMDDFYTKKVIVVYSTRLHDRAIKKALNMIANFTYGDNISDYAIIGYDRKGKEVYTINLSDLEY